MLKRIVKSQKITIITVQQWVREQQSTSRPTILFHIFALARRVVDWELRLANSERHWNCTAHFRYRGSIEYRDTSDGIVIVAPISCIAQHYLEETVYREGKGREGKGWNVGSWTTCVMSDEPLSCLTSFMSTRPSGRAAGGQTLAN